MSDFRLVLKKWGFEAWVVTALTHAAKLLFIEPSPRSSSLHYHRHKDETFLCLLGSCLLEVADGVGREPNSIAVIDSSVTGTVRLRARSLRPGDVQRVPPGVVHRFSAGPALLLEVSTSIDRQDDDTIRLTVSVGSLTDYAVCCVHDALVYARERCRRD